MGAILLRNPKHKVTQIVPFAYGTTLFWWYKTKKNQLSMEIGLGSEIIEAYEFHNFLHVMFESVKFWNFNENF